MSSIVHNSAIDFEQKVASSPQYMYTKVLQTQGGSTVAITANSSVTSYFDIPAKVVNFNKFLLRWTEQVTAGAAGYMRAMTDAPMIRRITLQNRSGQVICDIPNFRHYWKLTSNLIASNEEMGSTPGVGAGATAAGANLAGVCLGHNQSNALPGTVMASVDPNQYIQEVALVSNTAFRKAYQSQIPFVSALVTEQLNLTWELRFSKIPFCFLSLNRDFYSNESLQLVVEWENYDTHFFYGTSATVLTTALATITSAATLSNLALYCAVETNMDIANSVMSKVLTGGLQQMVPYPTITRVPLGTATSTFAQVKFGRNHGARLLRVISSEGLTTDTLARSHNYFNYNGVTTQVFRTTLNSIPQENESMTVINGDDHRYVCKLLRGTPLENIQEYYTQAPVYINDFSACNTLDEAPVKDLLACGLDLSQEQTWAKEITTKTAVDTTCTVIAIGQKTLMSGPEGVLVM